MNKDTLKKIFLRYDLGSINSFEKIDIGFSNEVYSVDDAYIVKVCEDAENETVFRKEAYLYDLFQDRLSAPKVIVFDESKSLHDKVFMIYSKIEGCNLYSIWHLIDDSERKDIIRQLCQILKVINETPYGEYIKKFDTDISTSWHDIIVKSIQNSLKGIEEKKLLHSELIAAVKKFVEDNHNVLNEQKMALVYWDAHFDNVLVKDGEVTGILDFERVDVASIDFTLDVFKRMVEYPKKYMSQRYEKYAKKEDYMYLMGWCKEFYPELFDFHDMEKRLSLYALEHDLKDVIGYPEDKELSRMLENIIDYKKTNLSKVIL